MDSLNPVLLSLYTHYINDKRGRGVQALLVTSEIPLDLGDMEGAL